MILKLVFGLTCLWGFFICGASSSCAINSHLCLRCVQDPNCMYAEIVTGGYECLAKMNFNYLLVKHTYRDGKGCVRMTKYKVKNMMQPQVSNQSKPILLPQEDESKSHPASNVFEKNETAALKFARNAAAHYIPSAERNSFHLTEANSRNHSWPTQMSRHRLVEEMRSTTTVSTPKLVISPPTWITTTTSSPDKYKESTRHGWRRQQNLTRNLNSSNIKASADSPVHLISTVRPIITTERTTEESIYTISTILPFRLFDERVEGESVELPRMEQESRGESTTKAHGKQIDLGTEKGDGMINGTITTDPIPSQSVRVEPTTQRIFTHSNPTHGNLLHSDFTTTIPTTTTTMTETLTTPLPTKTPLQTQTLPHTNSDANMAFPVTTTTTMAPSSTAEVRIQNTFNAAHESDMPLKIAIPYPAVPSLIHFPFLGLTTAPPTSYVTATPDTDMAASGFTTALDCNGWNRRSLFNQWVLASCRLMNLSTRDTPSRVPHYMMQWGMENPMLRRGDYCVKVIYQKRNCN